MSLRVLAVFGTRPEAIKMAPVVLRLAADDRFDARTCATAQHREMLDSALATFGIEPDHDLAVMAPGQDLFDVTSKALCGLRDVLRAERPDVVLVHGDTTTCLTGALAAFYERIPVGHVEAGLRTHDLARPFPEEANRSLVARLATFHFAPTERARQNLLAEGLRPELVRVTGNTVIDALHHVGDAVAGLPPRTFEAALGAPLRERLDVGDGRLVLVTAHRRESFGQGLDDLCSGLRRAALEHADWDLVYPLHPNPNVRRPVTERLGALPNVHLIDALDYRSFVWLLRRCDVVLTDSGGVQEEAPAFGKPVLVARETTERPEAVEAGCARLVGTDPERVVAALAELLAPGRDATLAAANPFGDGHAAERIAECLAERLGARRTVAA